MKTIIFGVGNYYKENKERLKEIPEIEVIAFSDNNATLWNRKLEGIKVVEPALINSLEYDRILIMSTYISEIYNQLISLNIDKEKIVIWEQAVAESMQGQMDIYPCEKKIQDIKGKILIISTRLNYNGGSLASVYGAMALKDRGIEVILTAPGGNEKFIREITDYGITVVICPAFPYIFDKEKEMIKKFDVVLVNVFQMIKCAQEVRKIRPVLWWIHEPSVLYPPIITKYPDCIDEEKLSDIEIYAVSKNAQKNFNMVFPDRIKKNLPYGIPDMSAKKTGIRKKNKKLIFAVIGIVSNLKSQDVFLDAVTEVRDSDRAEYWMIGNVPDDAYGRKIKDRSSEIQSVRLLGELTRKEIYEAFSEIDIVVCTSQEEMLSLVITEAMMFGKVCITNDHTGNIDYINHGINGFIVPRNDVQVLARQMEWMIENPDMLNEIGAKARKTYEENFSMDIFGQNLERALIKAKENWKASK